MKAPIQKKLHALRKKVENIDKKIISLLSNRFLITKQIQSLKTELGEARTQKAPEHDEVLAAVGVSFSIGGG